MLYEIATNSPVIQLMLTEYLLTGQIVWFEKTLLQTDTQSPSLAVFIIHRIFAV